MEFGQPIWAFGSSVLREILLSLLMVKILLLKVYEIYLFIYFAQSTGLSKLPFQGKLCVKVWEEACLEFFIINVLLFMW